MKQNFVSLYAITLTFIVIAIVLTSFNEKLQSEKFDEITVKRINMIGEDGSLRMVLSNETRQHPGRIDGKDLPARERGAGVLYFNYDGDECGGLLYGNVSKDSVASSSMSFTMDQYRQDQAIQLINSEYIDKGKASIEKGLVINEFPVGSSLSDAMKKWKSLKQ